MTARRSAIFLLLAALTLYLWVVQPDRERMSQADAFRMRAESDRARLRVNLSRALRRERGRAQISDALRQSSLQSPSAIRKRVLGALASFPVDGARLTVQAERPGGPTTVHVESAGRFLDLVAFSTRLAHPDLGLAFRRVSFSAASGSPAPGSPPATQVVIEASTLGGGR